MDDTSTSVSKRSRDEQKGMEEDTERREDTKREVCGKNSQKQDGTAQLF